MEAGTKEFLKGTNEFTVNVALIEAGQPMLGVVHGKLFEILFSGRRESRSLFAGSTDDGLGYGCGTVCCRSGGRRRLLLDGKRLGYGKAGLRNPAIMTIGDGDYDWAAPIAKPRN
jgi:hypothetical protein